MVFTRKQKNEKSNQNPGWCFFKFFLGNWIAIVSCISLFIKKIVESWQNNSRRGKTKWDGSLNWTFYWSFLHSWGIDHWLLYKGMNSLMFSKSREEDGDKKKYRYEDKLTSKGWSFSWDCFWSYLHGKGMLSIFE